MEIKQFEDKNLAHYSYAILSGGAVALIDPARDPQPYYDFAKANNAVITTVIETHPHADFVSSHIEIHKTTGATIYVSKLLGAEYEHETFDEGDAIVLGNITLKALNTPGHSPDSISIVAVDEQGKEHAVFTGDTLFIGDCGRPDLRETAGAITATRESLARQMYYSLRNKLMVLPGDVAVYPAHGAGSLCGKGLSTANRSTIGAEKISNWSLQEMTEKEFISSLLSNQPFIPKYFTFDVGINKKGADNYLQSVVGVPFESMEQNLKPGVLIIDTRPQQQFKNGHYKNAINLMDDTKFETWLGSIVNPGEQFYLVGNNEQSLKELVGRIAKIGYEKQVLAAWVIKKGFSVMMPFSENELKLHPHFYTIVDVRNESEVNTKKVFENAINIPLPTLRERVNEIPLDKPVVVHCAAGYRSAAGSSIIKSQLNSAVPVYDLSEAIKNYLS